jgi:hypothetical protein
VVCVPASVALSVDRPPSAEKKFSNSRRANASRLHNIGGPAGEVGLVPAVNGLSTMLTNPVTRFATAVSGFGGASATGATGCSAAERVTSVDESVVVALNVTMRIGGSSFGWGVVATVGEEPTVDAAKLDAAGELDAVFVAVAVAVEFDECLVVSSADGSVVGSGSAVGVAVAVADGSTVCVAVADGVGDAVALAVAAVEVPVEVEVLVCALTTTPGATSVAVDVGLCVPVVVVFADGPVVDCAVEPVVAGSGLAVPVEPVDVESVVDELDDPDVESVVSAEATPYPVATAVPTPSATASPPTRPMKNDAGILSPTSFPPTSIPAIKADATGPHSKRRKRLINLSGRCGVDLVGLLVGYPKNELRNEARFAKGLLVEVRRFGESVVDPGVDHSDPVGDELDLVDPDLEVVVAPERVDLLLGALDEDEAAQLHRLWFEDGGVEALDSAVFEQVREVARRRLLEQIERLRLASVGRQSPSNPQSGFSHGPKVHKAVVEQPQAPASWSRRSTRGDGPRSPLPGPSSRSPRRACAHRCRSRLASRSGPRGCTGRGSWAHTADRR